MRSTATAARRAQGRGRHHRPWAVAGSRPWVAALVLAVMLPQAATGVTVPPDEGRPGGSVLSAVLGARERPAALQGERAVTAAWAWPLAGRPDVVKDFDPPQERWLPGHRGIDLAGLLGEPVLAVDDGVVAYSGTVAGVGTVSVDHVSGLRSTYQPVSDRVARGARVARGELLGRLDTGGHCVVHDCLHLGARRGRHTYVDPRPLLEPVELSLLPVDPGTGRS